MLIDPTDNYIAIGILAIMVATLILAGLVHQDLAPRSGLSLNGRLLLMAGAGGAGILAFASKIVVLLLMMNMPSRLVQPFATSHSAIGVTSSTAAPSIGFTSRASAYVWTALPDRAPAPGGVHATPEQIALGEKLFSDKSLSITREVSCASCHDVAGKAGTDGLATSIGVHQQSGKRNAPTVWNAAFQKVLFWDGRAGSLEEQALGPLINPLEMAMPSLEAVEQRVSSSDEYQQAFRIAFGDKSEITIQRIAFAIASYERSLITPDTPYDRFVKGDAQALTPSQIRGMMLFEEVGCIRCHSGPNFSGASLLDDNSPLRVFPAIDSSLVLRYRLKQDTGAGLPSDASGVWRIPSLRNIALTGPYFHNGAVSSLKEAVRVMVATQVGRPLEPQSPRTSMVNWLPQTRTLSRIDNAPVTENEIEDIVTFLNALTSEKLHHSSRTDKSS